MHAAGLLQAAAPAAPTLGSVIWPMLLMLVLGYFLLIRPVQQQRRKLAEMRSALKAGDEVLTSGGLYGTVTKLRDERVVLRVADGVQVEVSREHVASTVPPPPRA
jgi:preprotein translocase subunit YajC